VSKKFSPFIWAEILKDFASRSHCLFAFLHAKLNLKYSNIYPTRWNVTQIILSGNCSTYFGWYHHPSSGAQTIVSTASVTLIYKIPLFRFEEMKCANYYVN